MESTEKLRLDILLAEHARARSQALLWQACPHARMTQTEYLDDDWAQNKTRVCIRRCPDCGFHIRTAEPCPPSGASDPSGAF